MEIMRSSECRLKLSHCGLLECLENHALLIFTCFFAISHCSVLLTQTYCEPGPPVELGLQELSAPLSLSICTEILNIFVNF